MENYLKMIWSLLYNVFVSLFPFLPLRHETKEQRQYALIMEKQQELFRLREWLDRAYDNYPDVARDQKRTITMKSGQVQEVEKRRFTLLKQMRKMYAEKRQVTELAARTSHSCYENRELKTELERDVFAFKQMQHELCKVNDWLDLTYAYLYRAGTREMYLGPECGREIYRDAAE